jgi:predicted transport protein
MTQYLNISCKLKIINEKPYKLEKEIQKLFEANLPLIMGLEVVKSEFSIKNKRIDTLAFDPQSKAFIIIEYKRDKNISVVDQGFTYLSLMMENKADFIIEYNENMKRTLKREDVDWSQTRVAFVSTGFTPNQIQATNFKDIAIELWEVNRFENDTISIEPIKKSISAESIKPLAQKDSSLKAVTDEIKVYTEDDHFKNTTSAVIEVYEKFRNAILNLADDIEIKPLKIYIAFKKDKNICDIGFYMKYFKLFINIKKGQLDDPKKITREVSSIGHHGNGDYAIQISDTDNLEYIMSLIKQAIK